MSPEATSIIRTVSAMVVGWFATVVAAKLGFIIDPATQVQLAALFGAAVSALYYIVIRFGEAHFPWIGKFLIVAKQPVYPPKV